MNITIISKFVWGIRANKNYSEFGKPNVIDDFVEGLSDNHRIDLGQSYFREKGDRLTSYPIIGICVYKSKRFSNPNGFQDAFDIKEIQRNIKTASDQLTPGILGDIQAFLKVKELPGLYHVVYFEYSDHE